jgi:hypothetical protein
MAESRASAGYSLQLQAIEDYRSFAALTVQRFWRGHATRAALRREVRRPRCWRMRCYNGGAAARTRPIDAVPPPRPFAPLAEEERVSACGRQRCSARDRGAAACSGARDPGRMACPTQHAGVCWPQGPVVLQVSSLMGSCAVAPWATVAAAAGAPASLHKREAAVPGASAMAACGANSPCASAAAANPAPQGHGQPARPAARRQSA